MNGDYIKIMSDGTQLFVKGTECFLSLNGQYVRPTVDQFVELIKRGVDDFLGEHIVGESIESEGKTRNIPNGTKTWDLEWCELSEFYFVYSSESKQIDREGNEI